MPELYNRDMCTLCPVNEDCGKIRWHIRCGTCSQSLTCAAGPGLGHKDCTYITADWRALPGNCLIGANRLGRYVKTGQTQDVFHFDQKENEAPQMICPRCGEATASKSIDMEMGDGFRMKKTAFLKCSRCGLDEHIPL